VTVPIAAFGLIRTNDLGGDIIRFATRSLVNHAFINLGSGLIVEARPKGASISPVTEYSDIKWVVLPEIFGKQDVIVAAAKKTVGIPYGWPDILALGFACYGIRNHWIDQRIEKENRLICSQLVDKVYEEAGIHLFDDGRLPGEVTPGDLYTKFKSYIIN
jgi:cell wall-associated NlpC family hydrolase